MNTTQNTRSLFRSLICLSWLFMTGCSSFDLSKRIPWSHTEDPLEVQPTRISAIWADTIMTQSDKTPMRGFGGRVMFYGKAEEPAKVEGVLEVYAYDETDRDPTDIKPNRKFVFKAEDMKKHYSKSRLGHSYSFWLPWDAVGGKQTEVSLIVRFKPTKGGLIIGEQSKQLLPGIAPELTAMQKQIQDHVRKQQMQNAPNGAQNASINQAANNQQANQQQSRIIDNQVKTSSYSESATGHSDQFSATIRPGQTATGNSSNNTQQGKTDSMDTFTIPVRPGTYLGAAQRNALVSAPAITTAGMNPNQMAVNPLQTAQTLGGSLPPVNQVMPPQNVNQPPAGQAMQTPPPAYGNGGFGMPGNYNSALYNNNFPTQRSQQTSELNNHATTNQAAMNERGSLQGQELNGASLPVGVNNR